MKWKIVTLFVFLSSITIAQEHFSGINSSKRVGILNATINPAELANLSNKFEASIFNISANVSNNKITVSDIISEDDFEDKIFTGSEPVNLRTDINILGPSFAFKSGKWAFGLISSGNIKANIIDVNVDLGNAINENILGLTEISANYNQRINAIMWGEIGLNLAREFNLTATHQLSAGATVRFLFPSTYMNLGISNLNGQIINTAGNIELTNATAQLNIAYSGPLADDFSKGDDFGEIFSGGINGIATDFGATYQWKPDEEYYKLKLGFAVRNIGKMTFKSDNNVNSEYDLDIDFDELESLNLNQFNDMESIEDIETILVNSGLVNKTETTKDFEIKLPTVLNLYADYRFTKRWHLSAYMQQKMNDDTENEFTTIQNVLTLTPRFSGKWFEIYAPLSQNEISDFTAGFGLRVGGFFLGSGSAITALLNDSHQADIYLGFRFGL